MKKAVIALYIIAAVQFLFSIVGFVVMKQAFYYAGEGIIKLCDERYVQK